MMRTMDALDARILLAVDDDPDATTLALAQRLGIARNTLQARLRRLRATGAVGQFSRRVDPAAPRPPAQTVTVTPGGWSDTSDVSPVPPGVTVTFGAADGAAPGRGYSRPTTLPPSTPIAMPLTNAAGWEHRNATTRPKSAGSPTGPVIVRPASRSVACSPGQARFTVMPSPARSCAAVFAHAHSPVRATFDSARSR